MNFIPFIFLSPYLQRFSRITTIGRRAASIPEDFDGAEEINLENEIQNGRLQQITSSEIGRARGLSIFSSEFILWQVLFLAFWFIR